MQNSKPIPSGAYDLKDMRRFLLSDLIDADGKRALQKYLKQLDNGQV